MERAYLYEDLFGELADKNSLYWNYFDNKGEIQVGWDLDGEPVMHYNRFDGANFIALLEDMLQFVQHEKLRQDIEYIIEETA